jgi:hypothetical protein
MIEEHAYDNGMQFMVSSSLEGSRYILYIIVITICVHNTAQEETHNRMVIMTSALFYWYLFIIAGTR